LKEVEAELRVKRGQRAAQLVVLFSPGVDLNSREASCRGGLQRMSRPVPDIQSLLHPEKERKNSHGSGKIKGISSSLLRDSGHVNQRRGEEPRHGLKKTARDRTRLGFRSQKKSEVANARKDGGPGGWD